MSVIKLTIRCNFLTTDTTQVLVSALEYTVRIDNCALVSLYGVFYSK